MEYGYIRVSSMGQNVARQVDALHEAGIDDCRIFTDKMSGKSFNRPAWKRLVKRLKSGDLLVVQSLDRLGRNYEEILEQWRILIKVKGVNIRILNMPLLDTANKTNGLIGKLVADLVLQLFSFVAESERANIKERQRQGIDAAMKRGVKFGRPKIGNAREIAECVARIKNGSLSIESAAKICRVSCTTIRSFGITVRKPYFVMSYSNDLPMCLTKAETVRIVCEVIRSCSTLPSFGLLHGDIKWENVGLEDGRVVLRDFSTLRTVRDATLHSALLGTRFCRAPETDYDGICDERTVISTSIFSAAFWIRADTPRRPSFPMTNKS